MLKEIIAVATLAVSLHASAFRLVDASTKAVMPLAAITDRSGNVVGMTDNNGEIPEISSDWYPITFNSMGYEQVEIKSGDPVQGCAGHCRNRQEEE